MVGVPSLVPDKDLAKMENLYNQLFWEKERSHSRNFIAVSCYSHSILLFVIVVNLSLCLIYKSPLSEVCMHRAGHSTRRVGYHAWFLDSTGGPASITLGYGGGTACGPAPQRGSRTWQGDSRSTSATASGLEVPTLGWLCPGGTLDGCLETCWSSWAGEDASSHPWIETREAGRHPPVHRTPHNRGWSTPRYQ